jgi:hypothetical protein
MQLIVDLEARGSTDLGRVEAGVGRNVVAHEY